MSLIIKNIAHINSIIRRKSSATSLIAVSKYRNISEILEAISAGQKIFGENKVQEAMSKWPQIKAQHPDIQLHLIGSLQTNKVKDALKLFDVIETLDRPKLLNSILKEAKNSRIPELYIQVNTGEESQKSGIPLAQADGFINECVKSGLPIKGLMCIPPVNDNPAKHFKILQGMAKRHEIEILSMGMSKDYETAIDHGATHIRIGTSIFGKRPQESA